MAKYSINIYGENDVVVKTYETDNILWGFYIEAVKASRDLDGMDEIEQFEMVNGFVKRMFIGLTDEELAHASGDDVMNVFQQLIRKANTIAGGKKNASAAEA